MIQYIRLYHAISSSSVNVALYTRSTMARRRCSIKYYGFDDANPPLTMDCRPSNPSTWKTEMSWRKFLSFVATKIILMTIRGVASGDKVGIIKTLDFQCYWESNPFSVPIFLWSTVTQQGIRWIHNLISSSGVQFNRLCMSQRLIFNSCGTNDNHICQKSLMGVVPVPFGTRVPFY